MYVISFISMLLRRAEFSVIRCSDYLRFTKRYKRIPIKTKDILRKQRASNQQKLKPFAYLRSDRLKKTLEKNNIMTWLNTVKKIELTLSLNKDQLPKLDTKGIYELRWNYGKDSSNKQDNYDTIITLIFSGPQTNKGLKETNRYISLPKKQQKLYLLDFCQVMHL